MTLDEWTTAVRLELGIEPGIDTHLVLDVARDAAHGVARPAAPLTAYLLGWAAGSGIPVTEAAERIRGLLPDVAG